MITQSVPLMIFVLLMSYHSVAAQDIIIAFPGQNVDVELMCDVTGDGGTAWQINGALHSPSELFAGVVAGHNISGRNLVVEDIIMNDVRNGSQYQCEITQIPPDPNIEGNLIILYVAGNPGNNCNASIEPDFLNRSNVTVTLKWIEPFTNFNSIENYTVSWNGSTFLSFVTTDNTTRSYTITNLTPMTNYIFSVVATNSVGSGSPCVLFYITPPAIDQVTGVDLSCEAMDFNNTCTVTWNPVIEGDITGYKINYNGTIENVTSPSTTLAFLAPPIPDNLFTDIVAVTVTAFNRLGVGPPSALVTTQIYASSVTDVTVTGSFNVTTQLTNMISITDEYVSYIITVTDIILLSMSNMTRVIFNTIPFNRRLEPGENFTFSLRPSGRNILLSVVNANGTSDATADMFNVTVARIEERYNISVVCNIHPESMADICLVAAIGTDNINISGNALINNNMANVMFAGLNCNEKYTIIAGGMLDGNLVGPKSSEGTIFMLACDSILELVERIFHKTKDAPCDEAIAISVIVTFTITLVVTALITFIITSLYYKHLTKKSDVNRSDAHALTEDIKRHGPTGATASAGITMDTNPAYGTTATIKMDTNPAYATTSH